MRMPRSSLVTITALNWDRFGNIKVAGLIGMGFAMGLYTAPARNDSVVMTEEFIGVNFPPSYEATKAAMLFWAPDVSAAHASACLDHFSYLGYCRISHTHPLDSSDPYRMDRQVAALVKIWEGTPIKADDITRDSLANLLHGPLHGASMGGAVGLMYEWTRSGPCSKIISIRGSPQGDRLKPEAITLAAYDAMSTHPALAAIMTGSESNANELREWLEGLGNAPWTTTSLHRYFSDEPLAVAPPAISRFTKVMACLIAAAADEELISDSFGTAYYVKNAKKSYSGGVAFWTAYFSGLNDSIKDMSTAEAQRVFASATAAVIPAMRPDVDYVNEA